MQEVPVGAARPPSNRSSRIVPLIVAAAGLALVARMVLGATTALGISQLLVFYMPLIALAAALALFFLTDRSDRDTLYQVLTFTLIAAGIAYLVMNTITNIEARKIATGYGFLENESRFAIGESMIDFTPASSFGRALLVGFFNTLKVAIIGIVLATLLGVTVGILSLSKNWLLVRLLGAYVSFMRNIPVLLHMILWYTVVTFMLPPLRAALSPVEGIYLSQRGLFFPVPVSAPGWTAAAIAVPIAIALMVLVGRLSRRQQAETGRPLPLLAINAALLLGLPALGWLLLGAPTAFSVPELKGFNFQGGSDLSAEFLAVLIGLTLYTAAYIAEITRSGILAVAHGQTEAGRSLGLSETVIMRMVILPQALRVIIPPLTNQFLNLTKNSSLAVQIGYPDLVSIGNTTLNQTGQAIEVISIIMIVYLSTSLATSLIMNWYNRRIQLVER